MRTLSAFRRKKEGAAPAICTSKSFTPEAEGRKTPPRGEHAALERSPAKHLDKPVSTDRKQTSETVEMVVCKLDHVQDCSSVPVLKVIDLSYS